LASLEGSGVLEVWEFRGLGVSAKEFVQKSMSSPASSHKIFKMNELKKFPGAVGAVQKLMSNI
jgi:hypothetical protein